MMKPKTIWRGKIRDCIVNDVERMTSRRGVGYLIVRTDKTATQIVYLPRNLWYQIWADWIVYRDQSLPELTGEDSKVREISRRLLGARITVRCSQIEHNNMIRWDAEVVSIQESTK